MRVLVTGTAGFIGSHIAMRLLARGDEVIGVDNLNAYYDPDLKRARLARFADHPGFTDIRADIADSAAMTEAFANHRPQRVIHLAAQVGVRYSLENPQAYVQSNLSGFMNVLEGCRNANVEHLVYASSSSIYGGNTRMPSTEHDNVDHPVSLYAATKKSNELMAHTYSHLFDLPTTGLRFFTVYGPWGRPDMAYFLFTKAILEGNPIKVFNRGNMHRDFTYIDDVVEGSVRIVDKVPEPLKGFDSADPDPATSWAPYRIYNLGNRRPVSLMNFIEAIETCLDKQAEKIFLPMQAGDVIATSADVSELERTIGFSPNTLIADGVRHFVDWYRSYYCV